MRAARLPLPILLCASVALSGVAPVLVAPVWAASAPSSLSIGQTADLTHLEFPASAVIAVNGPVASVRLPHAVITPEITRLKLSPPRFVKTATVEADQGGISLHLILADGADARSGKADGTAFLNLSASKPAPGVGQDQTPQGRPNPVPASGAVKLQPELRDHILLLKLAWKAPLGAAVFRRGDAIWVVFDAAAKLDLSAAPHGLPQAKRIEAVPGTAFTAFRIIAPPNITASASAAGGVWTIALGPAADAVPSVPIGRDDPSGPPGLSAQVSGSTGVFWIADPAVGDRLAVVTALAPAKGLAARQTFVEATLLPTSHGLVVSPRADDLQVRADGDLVRIGRPRGLALSPASLQSRRIEAPATEALALPAAAAMPGLIDFAAWSQVGARGFNARYQQLEDAAATEGGKGKVGGVQARLGLARFLVGSELAFEAQGILNLLAKSDRSMLGDAEFRGLRGAARAMSGRYRDAQADFSSPVVSDDPASSLWRGYAAQKLGDDAGARKQFEAGRSALNMMHGPWRARLAQTWAEAALAGGDLVNARTALSIASAEKLQGDDAGAFTLAEARLNEAANQPDQAIALYDKVASSTFDGLAAPAILRGVQLKLARGKITPDAAVAALDSVRFRWRGDATELETVRALGRINLTQGHYREALEALRSAGQRQVGSAGAAGIATDIATAFKTLFLNGGADGMQPVQALALFYDFRDFTPIGADGDLMVRKLARRLVDVDLLDQGAELLKYQAENRLDGVPRAEVSTDLAMIQLMNHKPEAALDAINTSRTTLLPVALNQRRRMIEARAMMALGRYDHALELVSPDKTAEAQGVRSEVAWKQKTWPQAGMLLEVSLGERWKNPAPLNDDEQARLLRAGVAYSLSGDQAGLARLRTRYGKLAEQGSAPDALRVALAGGDAASLNPADFNRASSDAQIFAGWVAAMKRRFHEAPAPVGTPKPVQTAAAAPVAKTGG